MTNLDRALGLAILLLIASVTVLIGSVAYDLITGRTCISLEGR